MVDCGIYRMFLKILLKFADIHSYRCLLPVIFRKSTEPDKKLFDQILG